MNFKPIPLLATVLLGCAAASADTPAEIFQIQCSACHNVDQKIVGPSLVEISSIYANDPEGFVNWCLKPGKKRPEAVEMPSMAHLGPDTLRQIHGYVLEAAKGKKERAVEETPVVTDENRRPRVQRIFLPDASPAAIAVAMPGDLSFCFDAAECRLRYVWKGGFIDGKDHWKGNGSALGKISGKVIYREAAFPLEGGSSATPPKFLGYSMSDGLPVFHYRRGGIQYSEKITPLPDGSGIEREFSITGTSSGLVVKSADEGAVVTSSTGTGPVTASRFTLTYRWK